MVLPPHPHLPCSLLNPPLPNPSPPLPHVPLLLRPCLPQPLPLLRILRGYAESPAEIQSLIPFDSPNCLYSTYPSLYPPSLISSKLPISICLLHIDLPQHLETPNSLIVCATATAQLHSRNYRQFAQDLKLVGSLLRQLRISEFRKYPET